MTTDHDMPRKKYTGWWNREAKGEGGEGRKRGKRLIMCGAQTASTSGEGVPLC